MLHFILHEMQVGCDKQHDHEILLNGKATEAAIYPIKSCRSILRGVRLQLIHDGRMSLNHVGVEMEEENHDEWGEEYGPYVDDISGAQLDPTLVRAARDEAIPSLSVIFTPLFPFLIVGKSLIRNPLELC